MPELPDVEKFKRYFEKTSLNKKIVEVECKAKRLIKKITFKDFRKKLIGKTFQSCWRRGKFLIVKVKESSEKLVIHFGMTGSLKYVKSEAIKSEKDKFARLIFKFKNGDEFRWLNVRKLGKVYLVKDLKEIKLLKEMGEEPLKISKKEFLELLSKKENRNIKSFLLDQREIAGIGNIYSDEILFRAKINPHRKIKTLNLKEREKLYKAMIEVLKQAIQIQCFEEKFPENLWLIPHRNKDMKCPRNKNHRLKREIIASRAAIYCPKCQK